MAPHEPVTVTDAVCHELLATASWELARKLPFLGHVLAALDRVIDTSIPTAAVGAGHDGQPTLYINPTFFGVKLTRDDHRVAVLEHEVLHVVFGHLRLNNAAMPSARRRAISMDISVNQFVSHPLPRNAVTLKSFHFPVGLTTEMYYDLLAKIPDVELARFGKDIFRGHDLWRDGPPEENGRRLADAVDGIVTEALRRADHDGSFESLPGNLKQSLLRDRFCTTGATDWRRALHLFSARALRSGVRATNQRESRRYGAERGRWDGPIVPGLRHGRRRPTLAVAIDTSGSISLETVGRFFHEVSRIVATGAMVHVVECDALVQAEYPWTGVPPQMSKGGGGTDFDPVFRWLRDAGGRLNLSGLVYLTDGYAQRPQLRPPVSVLWAITANGTTANIAYGPSLSLPA